MMQRTCGISMMPHMKLQTMRNSLCQKPHKYWGFLRKSNIISQLHNLYVFGDFICFWENQVVFREIFSFLGCIDKAKISDLLPIHIDGMHTLDMRRLLHCLYRLLYMPLRQREKRSEE